MNNYNLAGAAALVLAVLYPIYWVFSLALGFGEGSLFEAFKADVQRLDGWDALFVLIGALEVYVYLSLRSLLQQRLHAGLGSLLALLLAIVVAAFTATVLFDLVLAMGQGMSESARATLLTFAVVVNIALAMLLSLLGLVLGCALLFGKADSAPLLKLFAILLLLASLLNLSVILSFLSLLVYPLALVFLAVVFLKGGHEVEVI